MNEWLRRVRAQAEEFWKSLSPSRRTMLIAGVAALVGTLVLIGSLSSRPHFVPLFTRLEPQDAGLIVAKLKEAGIPYKLEANGTAILVPEEHVYETRLSMASQGLPRGGVFGFELFNETQLGTTDFERRLKYNWALQGELTRTIRNLSEVEDARVHIVLPERSLFVQEEKEPTASVLLKLKPYAQLTEEQIRGIAHLLAGSVEGLKPENVTILDSSGNILSEFLADEVKDRQPGSFSDRKLAAQMQARRDLERELSRSVQTMLERVFGPGRVVARVSAELNFDYEESNSELFTPVTGESGILRSQQEETERYIEQFVAAGAAILTVQVEATTH
ncbi:MAG: flagellar basal-body MS-ring/collar protein FliF, partial [Bacillota bacterium]|nr:flagellar basal-body MS-ring/collar protein FliF [Bacillota bacterium]